MTRWLFFLKADRERDLSTIASGTAWALEVLRGLGFVQDDRLVPPRDDSQSLKAIWGLVCQTNCDTEWDREQWTKSVHALRSVASRVEKFRGRKADIEPHEADKIAGAFLWLAKPTLQLESKPISELRIKLIPEMPRDQTGTQRIANFATAACVLFQSLFCSMVPMNADHLCKDCLRELPMTAKGRTSRAKRCKRCAYRAWWHNKPRAERKRIQNEKMATWRENTSRIEE